MKNAKQLRDERILKMEALRSIDATAETEKRGLNADEKTNYDAILAEVSELDSDIKRAEAREALAIRSIASGVGSASGLTESDKRDMSQYSYTRAINALVNGKNLDGLEGEMHTEAVNQYRAAGLSVQGNLLVPQNVMNLKRTVNATGGTLGDQGGMTIETSKGSLIERLKARLVVAGMGATILDDLRGNVDFPKFVPNDTAADKTEVAAANASSPTFATVSVTPRRLPVYTEVSRQFLAQTSVSANNMFMDDLAFQIAKVMDASAISAILAEVGIGDVAGGTDGAAPTWANMVALETAVAAANADYGSLGYITNPKVRGKLKTTPKFSNTGEPIWENDGTLNGYRTGVSTQIPSTLTKGTSVGVASAIIFGNFRDLIMAQWGGIEFLVNPYTLDTTGLVRINAWTFYDEAIRNAQSFAAMKDALTV